MPRRRWRLKARRESLSGSLRFHLETGDYPAKEHFRSWPDVFFATAGQLRALWRKHGAEIVATWAAGHPGSRPWAWWEYDAPEPRAGLEAEATYLRRLDLLLPGEAERIPAEAFEPEIVEIPELPVLDELSMRPPSAPALASTNGKPRRPAA